MNRLIVVDRYSQKKSIESFYCRQLGFTKFKRFLSKVTGYLAANECKIYIFVNGVDNPERISNVHFDFYNENTKRELSRDIFEISKRVIFEHKRRMELQ